MSIIILLVSELKNQCNVGRPEFKLEDLIFLCILLQKNVFLSLFLHVL